MNASARLTDQIKKKKKDEEFDLIRFSDLFVRGPSMSDK